MSGKLIKIAEDIFFEVKPKPCIVGAHAVEGQAVWIVVVVGGEEFPPRARCRRDLLAQIRVGKYPVADEVDGGNACRRACASTAPRTMPPVWRFPNG